MSDDSQSDGADGTELVKVTRRRALAGLAVVGAVSASAGAGTSAFFSDTVETQDNTIQTGEINLTTNGDNNPTTTISVGPIGPGQSGSQSLTLRNEGSIDGFLSLDFGTPDARNELTEVLEVTVSIGSTTLRQGTFDTVFDGEGEWSNADIPLPAGGNKPLTIDHTLTEGAGNDVAGIEAVGDIAIQLNQEEEAFADLVVDENSGSGNVSTIQEAVNDVPETGVILVRNGTYNEAVTVDTAGITIASKNGPSNAALVADASGGDNAALLVDGVNDVTVDGLRVTHDNSVQAPNAEKDGIRGRPINNSGGSGPNGLTVRNCIVEGIQSEDTTNNSGAIRANGISVDMEPQSFAASSVVDVTIENNTIRNIITTGSTSNAGDSRAKGISMNGDIDGAAVVFNDITNIGATSGDDPNVGTGDTATGGTTGTEKPRGVTITEDSAGVGTTDFTILSNLISGVEGLVGQPAIFVGGTNALADHEVYDNTFEHPVDNLSGDALVLRSNTWVDDADDDGVPELVPPDQDEDGGNLIDRGSGAYDTTYTI